MDADQRAYIALKGLRSRAGFSTRELADLLEMPHSSYASYERETYKKPYLPIDLVKKLRPLLVGRGLPPVTEDDVMALGGITPSQSVRPRAARAVSGSGIEFRGATYLPLPVFDVSVSAGPGAINAESPEPESWTLFGVDSLRGLTRAPLEHLAIVRVSGDSMVPTLQNGDAILVDRTVRAMGRDGLYVLAAGLDVMVKRISRDWASKSLTITSDNAAYPPSTGVGEDDIAILGRVVWLSRNVGG